MCLEARSHRGGTRDTAAEEVPKKIGGEARGACNFCFTGWDWDWVTQGPRIGNARFSGSLADPAGDFEQVRQVRGRRGVLQLRQRSKHFRAFLFLVSLFLDFIAMRLPDGVVQSGLLLNNMPDTCFYGAERERA